MKNSCLFLLASLLLWGCNAFDLSAVADASGEQVERVEPLSWWTGMQMPLQLLVKGKNVSACDITIAGGPGVKVTGVTPGDSPDYLFVDVAVSASARPGTYWLVFNPKDGGDSFKFPYEIGARSRERRKSFSSEDMIYLIMPDRFANGDPANDTVEGLPDGADRSADFGRHGGDLRGMMDHLDYIEGLGATAVWSTPLLLDNQPRSSYHGYACCDYYQIDPRYGDNELYRAFVDSCHAHGIKVVMDVVTNHCGTCHWWMENPPFKDWYHVFPTYTGTNVLFSAYMDPHASDYDRNLQESGWFVPSMPDMNLDNPFVLRYFQQWAVWWTEYAGLDGFRVDTYPYNEPGPMSRWCEAVRKEYPWMNIVGECWDTEVCQLAYWQSGAKNHDGFDSHLPCIMDFPLREALVAALNEDTAGWGQGMSRVYGSMAHDFAYADPENMMIFLANHDHSRMADVLQHDPARMKIGLALLATLRGIPQLYYGDEMFFAANGGRDNDGAKRIDFPGGWEGDPVDCFTPEGREKGGVSDLYDYTARLFNWRKGCPVIHHGKTLHFLGRDNTYAYFRYNETDKVFVFVNNSLEEMTVPWSHYAEIVSGPSEATDVLTGEKILLSDETTVPAKSVIVAELLSL